TDPGGQGWGLRPGGSHGGSHRPGAEHGQDGPGGGVHGGPHGREVVLTGSPAHEIPRGGVLFPSNDVGHSAPQSPSSQAPLGSARREAELPERATSLHLRQDGKQSFP